MRAAFFESCLFVFLYLSMSVYTHTAFYNTFERYLDR